MTISISAGILWEHTAFCSNEREELTPICQSENQSYHLKFVSLCVLDIESIYDNDYLYNSILKSAFWVSATLYLFKAAVVVLIQQFLSLILKIKKIIHFNNFCTKLNYCLPIFSHKQLLPERWSN